jgi:hypothetical protein
LFESIFNGEIDGRSDGRSDGTLDGCLLGIALVPIDPTQVKSIGLFVLTSDGSLDGMLDGIVDGILEGRPDGRPSDGNPDGALVGNESVAFGGKEEDPIDPTQEKFRGWVSVLDGSIETVSEGTREGTPDGELLGLSLVTDVGDVVSLSVSPTDVSSIGEEVGSVVGNLDGSWEGLFEVKLDKI